MRPLAGAVAVLAALAVLSVVLLSIDTQQEPSELLLWRPVLNEPKTSQQLSVKNHDKKDVIAVPKGNTFLYQVATQHDEALARKYATHTASKMQVVCGGADFNAEACAEWYTPDVTVYDMAPPDGVIRGRENWRQRLQHDFQAVPTDLEMEIVHAGWVGYGSELIWTIGYMKKYVNGHKVGTFRFSSMMCNDHGIWRFYVFSVIHLYAHPNWTPVLHGRGQRLLAIARRDMAQFAKGYKTGNMKLAFKDYTPTARFPFMAQLGGTTVKFAEKEIMVRLSSRFWPCEFVQHEKKKLEKKQKTMIHPRVDEVLYPVSDATLDVAVAHGFSEMTDDRDAGMYSINRFTFLAVMVKRNNKWEVQYDFSPNAWLYGGSGE